MRLVEAVREGHTLRALLHCPTQGTAALTARRVIVLLHPAVQL